MTHHLHSKIVKSKTPFANAVIAAYVIGIASLITITGDLVWLVGDMRVQTHPHHYLVLCFLVPGNILTFASFIWLYLSMNLFLKKKEIKTRQQLEDYMVCRFRVLKEESVDLTELDTLNDELIHLHIEETVMRRSQP
jgi:hypothetical protein